MVFALKSDVSVAVDPAETGNRTEMVVLEAGTRLADISDYQKAQLAPDHFRDEQGNTPKDWRSKERQQKDVEQREFLDHYIETHTKKPGA